MVKRSNSAGSMCEGPVRGLTLETPRYSANAWMRLTSRTYTVGPAHGDPQDYRVSENLRVGPLCWTYLASYFNFCAATLC